MSTKYRVGSAQLMVIAVSTTYMLTNSSIWALLTSADSA
jgi:hypothetical protein